MCSIPEELNFSVRTFNCLKRAGIHTFEDVCIKLDEGIPSCMLIRNLDQKGLEEMLFKAQEAGYSADQIVDRYVSSMRTDPKSAYDAICYWEKLRDLLRSVNIMPTIHK